MCSNLCRKTALKGLRFYESMRHYSLTLPCSSKKREARFLNKLLGFSKPKRKLLIFNNTVNLTNPIDAISHRAPKVTSKRRQDVLNKLFMKNITDIMVTRSLGLDVIEEGLEITRVAISADYSFLNAYYIIQNENPDLKNRLHLLGLSLRHELSQLKLMGNVPRIKFIKEKDNNVILVDHLLSKVDIKVEDDELPGEMENEIEEALPPMENTIYGLNHSKIMETIKCYQKKASAHHRQVPKVDEETPLNQEDCNPSELKEAPKNQLDSKLLIRNFISSRKNKA